MMANVMMVIDRRPTFLGMASGRSSKRKRHRNNQSPQCFHFVLLRGMNCNNSLGRDCIPRHRNLAFKRNLSQSASNFRCAGRTGSSSRIGLDAALGHPAVAERPKREVGIFGVAMAGRRDMPAAWPCFHCSGSSARKLGPPHKGLPRLLVAQRFVGIVLGCKAPGGRWIHNWWPGKHFQLAPYAVKDIDWAERHVNVSVTRDQVRLSPAWDPLAMPDEIGEQRYNGHFGWPGYGW
jgi:hypothetical protein